ncbi:MAG: threonylcarbamoyl-AMP synthase [Opitutales bacterium]|nr:threonylcarbamoyl-AMP synthase [Opitutales bacterium]
MTAEVTAAVEALANDDVVVLPTETVYGLAGSIESEIALRKIFQIKNRPLLDPLIVHILDGSWIERCAYIDGIEQQVHALIEAFWPGPLTIILKKKPSIQMLVTSGLDTVALRCPAHETFREVLKKFNIPLAAPSANPFGYLSPTTAQHVRDTLGNKVKVIVDGGKCTVGVESTILNLASSLPCIARPGAISAGDIADTLGTMVLDYKPELKNFSVPGQLPQHYSPHTKLKLFGIRDDVRNIMDTHHDEHAAYVCLRRTADVSNRNDVYWLSEDGDYKVIASSLFNMLQTLDGAHYDTIYCQCPENIGIGLAINDRLSRAAAKFVEK